MRGFCFPKHTDADLRQLMVPDEGLLDVRGWIRRAAGSSIFRTERSTVKESGSRTGGHVVVTVAFVLADVVLLIVASVVVDSVGSESSSAGNRRRRTVLHMPVGR